jgi:hypothetical protein
VNTARAIKNYGTPADDPRELFRKCFVNVLGMAAATAMVRKQNPRQGFEGF